jgi:hypothetical protein
MLFEASNRKLGFAGLMTLAFSLAFSGDARADGPKITTEKGKPGSGIKLITRYHSQVGTGATPRYVETSRHTIYTDGRDEWRYFDDQGRIVRQETRYQAGHKVVVLNTDVDMPARISLGVNDELYLVSNAGDPWPGSRSVKASVDVSVIKDSSANLAGLPSDYKQVAAFKGAKAGTGSLTVATTVVTPGFPGPHGRPPASSITTRVVEVVVR